MPLNTPTTLRVIRYSSAVSPSTTALRTGMSAVRSRFSGKAFMNSRSSFE